jgi:hypothetical protein
MNDVLFEDCRIIFRNFSGAEGRYNVKGNRNFNLLLDPETAEQMKADGWNVKYLKPRPGEEDEPPTPRLEVTVEYRKGRPPRVVLITSRGRTNLNEDMVDILDWADFKQVDLILHPFEWNYNGKSGVKAYLASIYVTIREDALELKYAEVPEIDSAQSAIMEGEVISEEIEYHQPRGIGRGQRAIGPGETPF